MMFLNDGKFLKFGLSSSSSKKSRLKGTTPDKLGVLLDACRKNLPSVNEDLITRAYHFTLNAHKDHLRKSGEPYFTHPLAVAMIVAEEIPLDDVSVVSALLHDVVEDTDFTYEDVKAEFGETVADIVEGATKISGVFKSREVTKAESYRKLLISLVNDIRVILIKFADRLHNMRTLEFVPREKQFRIAKETYEIYAPLAHRFGLAKIKWELEDLSFKYLHEEDYRDLKARISDKRREREEYIGTFCDPIKTSLEEHHFIFDISGRPKNLFSIYNKMVERNKPFDEIYDLFAIRIILDTENPNDCFTVYGIVSEIYTPIPERFKNYISLPKQNGYQSVHTTVLGLQGKMVEVQIRSRHMHEIAEKGVAAHWQYKEGNNGPQSTFDNWVGWVREMFEQPQSSTSEEEGAQQLIEGFKRNLYQEEIVVFTPKGDLKVLPNGSTPLDFAFEIHSAVGLKCIGAKVNGRIVPLTHTLRSGDQIEIITSKNQTPNPDWEKIVITHKAKVAIRRWITDQNKEIISRGRELWEKRAKKLKLHANDDALIKVATQLHFDNVPKMFLAVGKDEIDLDVIVGAIRTPAAQKEEKQLPTKTGQEVFETFVRESRSTHGIILDGTIDRLEYQYAKCCNPLPGDQVIGFITQGHGLKVHRKNCQNILRLQCDAETIDKSLQDRLVDISWPSTGEATFLSGIRISGDDRPGVLNEIAHAISSYMNTNIRSVNIETTQSAFYGSVLVYVENLEHLQRLMEKIRKVKGVSQVERYVETT